MRQPSVAEQPDRGGRAVAAAVELAADIVSIVGESPIWSVREQALYWIDGQARRIMRLHWPDRRLESRELPYRPSCIALLPEAGLLVGYKKGLGAFDFDSGAARSLPLEGVAFDVESFNDGACDAAGRFWIGTRHRDASEAVCALFCIETDLRVRRVIDGIIVSNGIAFSPDGRTMYHTDSRPGRIDAYDYDVATGALSGRRRLLDYQGKDRRPDGCTVDAQGYLWVAEIDGSRLARYAPDGGLDRTEMLPVSKPASVGFGGADMRTLFITTISYGLDAAARQAQPWAGKLLAMRTDVPGLPEPPFRGA
jgi:L-arabinonolactonase